MTFEKPQERVEQVNIPKAYEKALKELKEYQIDPDNFRDIYDPEKINRDLEYVDKKKKEWNSQSIEIHDEVNKKLATIFEAMIFSEGESSEWFGEDASLIKTSEYDDIANGVDAVVEYQEESSVSRLALAIDVTFNHDVQKKITRIKRSIEEGVLTKVKYYESEKEDFKGIIKNVPHIIIGADVDTVRELTNEWADGKVTTLGQHGVQFQFFDEAIMQCKFFANYAREKGQEEVAKKYDSTRKILENQLAKKNKQLQDVGTRDSFMDDFQQHLGLEF